ncbi:MAG TPA: glycosyltransferase [Vicinamibacterales bacterium]|nr:glycosyltransferase [Vicinamibacterales bacterium]
MIPTLTGGGAERVAVTVLSAMDATRYERTLYVFSASEGVYFDHIAPGVRVVVATQRSWLSRLWELAAFLRSSRPDIVMPFLSYFITALAVRLAGGTARVIFNQQTPTSGFLDDPDFGWSGGWRRRCFAVATRLFYSRADAVVVTSRGVADDLISRYGVPAARIRVLHNPVDLDAIARLANEPVDAAVGADRPVLAAAGRLAGVKNYPLMIAAVADLVSRDPVFLWILGDGSERARLEALARDGGIARFVRFLGFQQNPFRYIAKADVFVLTSTYEGFGNVLIEAMACGTPVVATKSPGTIEIIADGENGLLVDHDAAAIAAAISALLANPRRRDALIAGGRSAVQHYALPAVAARYDRLFQEIAA